MTESEILNCQHCSKEYVRRGSLERHIKTKHMDQAAQVEQDKTHSETRIEIANSGPYFGDLDIPDNIDDFLQEAMEEHELRELAEEIDPSCTNCSDSLTREKIMNKRLRALQNSKKLLQKLNKDKSIELSESRLLLERTIKENTKLKMEKIANVPKPSTSEEDMQVVGGVPCTYCDYVANSMTELNSHFGKHHKLSCTKCDEKFLHKNSLEAHTKEKHGNKSIIKTTFKGYVCDVCKKVSKTKETNIEHAKSHQKDNSVVVHECPLCHYVTKDSEEVDVHMKQKHNIRVFRCQFCTDFVASSNEALSIHMKEHQARIKQLSCGHCDYKTDTGEKLTEHMDSEHVYQETPTKQCRFYKKGTCNRAPGTCKFKHEGVSTKSNPKNSETRETAACTRGSQCKFKEQNRCHFFHQGIGVQMPKEAQPEKQSEVPQKKTAQRLWCKFQDTCKKGPLQCPFRHYEVEFPRLPASRAGNMNK